MVLREVDVKALALERLHSLIGPERSDRFEAMAAATRASLQGRTVLNVNSTATGGGVAEMLQTLLAYARGAGVNARWVVIEGDPRFFEITKRLHNHLYGTPGDGGPLGPAERADYEATLRAQRRGRAESDRRRRHRRAARSAARGARRGGKGGRRACRVALPRRCRYAERPV